MKKMLSDCCKRSIYLCEKGKFGSVVPIEFRCSYCTKELHLDLTFTPYTKDNTIYVTTMAEGEGSEIF